MSIENSGTSPELSKIRRIYEMGGIRRLIGNNQGGRQKENQESIVYWKTKQTKKIYQVGRNEQLSNTDDKLSVMGTEIH